ncbi:hypothetical protein GGP89_000060 [Salinibacter ruber]|nr:hypothetical protein [Salinibacter ruber]MCS4150312.1 hypothetical protein [Salinibacter ruber]
MLVSQFIASSHRENRERWCRTGRKKPVDAAHRAKMPLP